MPIIIVVGRGNRLFAVAKTPTWQRASHIEFQLVPALSRVLLIIMAVSFVADDKVYHRAANGDVTAAVQSHMSRKCKTNWSVSVNAIPGKSGALMSMQEDNTVADCTVHRSGRPAYSPPRRMLCSHEDEDDVMGGLFKTVCKSGQVRILHKAKSRPMRLQCA